MPQVIWETAAAAKSSVKVPLNVRETAAAATSTVKNPLNPSRVISDSFRPCRQ